VSEQRGIEALLNGQSSASATSEGGAHDPMAFTTSEGGASDPTASATAGGEAFAPTAVDSVTGGPYVVSEGGSALNADGVRGTDGHVDAGLPGPDHPGQLDTGSPLSVGDPVGMDPLYHVRGPSFPDTQDTAFPIAGDPSDPRGPFDPNGLSDPSGLDGQGPADPMGSDPRFVDPVGTNGPFSPDDSVNSDGPSDPTGSVGQNGPAFPNDPGGSSSDIPPPLNPNGPGGNGTGAPGLPSLPNSGGAGGGPSLGGMPNLGKSGTGNSPGKKVPAPPDPAKTREVKHDAVINLGQTIYNGPGATAATVKQQPENNHIGLLDCGIAGMGISGSHGKVCASSARYIEAIRQQMQIWRDDLQRSGEKWKLTEGDVIQSVKATGGEP
jgi:hypothetical protein